MNETNGDILVKGLQFSHTTLFRAQIPV